MSNRIQKNLEAIENNANANEAKPSKRLVGNDQAKSQDFVQKTQETAVDEGFRNVSKGWYKKTHEFDYAFEQIAAGRAETEDLELSFREIMPVIGEENRVGFMLYKNSRVYYPTAHALTQIAQRTDISSTITAFMTPKLNRDGSVKYERDHGDAEVVLKIIENGIRPDRIDNDKKFLWRTSSKNSTIRAMLTDQYAILDNEWLLSVFRKAIPNARVSHWRGDSDTFYCNLLIPDTIREESDSDYGAMVSTGNSEIGDGKSKAIPSLFRGICYNGIVHGAITGEGLCKIHKGKRFDLFDLERQIIEGLNEQIPLIPQSIDRLLNTRKLAWDGGSIKSLIAQVAHDYSLDKRQATETLTGYRTEVNEASVNRNTLFGVINAVTRAAQSFDDAKTWERLNVIGGTMMEMSGDRWDALTKRAKTLTSKEVELAFSNN